MQNNLTNNPCQMDTLSKGAFKPIYPLIASQITRKLKIKEGLCVDVGAGPASLSIALAKITDLKIYAMDIKEEMLEIAAKNIAEEGLNDKIIPIMGDVHQMPFDGQFANLIVSRGSLPFWKDLPAAFSEIYRVLKPGGAAYIGGGFGSRRLKETIRKELENKKYETKKDSSDDFRITPPKLDIDSLEIAVKKAQINSYLIIKDDSGLWVSIKKPYLNNIIKQ